MNERENLITKIRELSKEFDENPQAAKDFLIRAGIIDSGGDLTEPYRR